MTGFPWGTEKQIPCRAAALVRGEDLDQALKMHGRPAREAGVVPGTENDQSGRLYGLMEAVRSGGGGKIVLEPGTYYVHDLPPVTGVFLEGMPGTRLKAPAGSGGRVIASPDFANQVGQDDWAGLAANNFGFVNLIIDANVAQQSVPSDQRDFHCAYMVYGYHFTLHNLRFEGAVGHALRSAWGRWGEFPMESHVSSIYIDGANRHGILWDGPHDSVISEVFPVDCSQESDNSWCGVATSYNGGSCHWSRFHAWHRSTTTNRMRASFASSGGSTVRDSQFEGGRVLFESGGSDIIGGKFYASFGPAGGCMLDVKGNLTTLEAGATFENSTAADVFAIRLGRSTSKISGFVMPPGLISGFNTRGAVDFSGSAGGNSIYADGYSNLAPSGIPTRDRVRFNFNSPDVVVCNDLLPGPYANAAAAKVANVAYGMPFLQTDGTVRWVNV